MEESTLQENKSFIQGLEDAKKGFAIPSEKIIWAEKNFLKDEWNNFYKFNSSYCKIEDVQMGNTIVKVLAGFCMRLKDFEEENKNFNSGLYEMSDEHKRIVDNYRRANHIYPTPFQDLCKPNFNA